MLALIGDMDIDGDVDFDDIDDFVFGLTDPTAYENQFGVPPQVQGDTDGDGDLDFDDISLFVELLPALPVAITAGLANDTAPGGTTNDDGITFEALLAGAITNGLANVQSIQAWLDAGSFVNVPFDGSGNFSFDPVLPADGSADGDHTVRFQVTDTGNRVAALLDVSFLLDTVACICPFWHLFPRSRARAPT